MDQDRRRLWAGNMNHYFSSQGCKKTNFVHFNTSHRQGLLPRRHLRLVLDLTLLSPTPTHAREMLSLLSHPTTPISTRVATVDFLANAISETSQQSSSKLKHHLQLSNFDLLVEALQHNRHIPSHLVPGILVGLAATFDTSLIVMPDVQVTRVVDGVLSVLSTSLSVLPLEGEELQLPSVRGCQFNSSGSQEAQLQRCTVAYCFGVLYNLVKMDACRKALHKHEQFLQLSTSTLSFPQLFHAHFACLHVLATMEHHGMLPPAYRSVLFCHLQAFLTYFPVARSPANLASHLGIWMSGHDMAAFYVPLLGSRSLDCVRLATFAILMYHYLAL
eukprot:NODE_740_length_1477_cov_4.539216_g612_i0.p1 GENE.NODE_740_length_1477_cov_4.539216_g612_i0~~NODE_740_length_1477_cov_4.539216_g612_i0.p1  ORF type:complete len:331 (+),score=46.88 NODE_740_length_1477_cov_4.539216_g612_i0:212-1204(+)